MNFELGANNTSDELSITNALTKGGGSGGYTFELSGEHHPDGTVGTYGPGTYTLMTFGSDNGFTANDFTAAGYTSDLIPTFSLINAAAGDVGSLVVNLLKISGNGSGPTVSYGTNLSLAGGSTLDFGLYEGDTPNSDQVNLSGQFNWSSAGDIDLAFSSYGGQLTAGTMFTLFTFQSTNFTDASSFKAVTGANLSSIDGSFILTQPDPTNNLPGMLQFQLISADATPEPGSMALLLSLAGPLGAHGFWRFSRRARRI